MSSRSSRRYRPAWEADPQFKGWLTDVKGDASKAFCKLCKCTLQSHKTDLKYHADSKKHKEALKFSQLGSNNKKLTTFFNTDISSDRKIAEIKVSAFIAEHCSMLTVDHLGKLISTLDKSSVLLNDMKLHRTKCTGIIANVISPCLLKKILEDVGESNFSIIIDESTAIDTKKMLCMIIRYYSQTSLKVVTTFYKLLEIDGGDADTLTRAFKDQLVTDGLDIKKLVGIGIDGANVMIGSNHSFSSILKESVPHLCVVKCVSHSLHLAAEYACRALPTNLEFLVKECHNWFSCSSKRQIDYNILYETIAGKNPLKMDKLSGTRWLARIGAVTKILEQWDVLELHFRVAKDRERCYTAAQLHLMLSSQSNKMYFLFMKQSLKAITGVNRMFQSENVDPLKLLTELNNLLTSYLSILIPPDRLQNIRTNELPTYKFRDHVMNIRCIQFGYAFNEESVGVDENDLKIIKERCVTFLIELCEQIQKRIPQNMRVLEKLCLFHPATATSQVRPDINDVVSNFKDVFGGIDNLEAALNEWRILPLQPWHKTNSTEEFWGEVSAYKNAAGEVAFPNITKLATCLLSLPFSNASVERAFSIMNVVKNKQRNKLFTSTTDHIMRIRFYLQSSGGCINFEPNNEMLKKFNSENVYTTKLNEDEATQVLDSFIES